MKDIAVMTICRDENLILRDFVEHYKELKFDNIIFIDDRRSQSDDDPYEMISDYVDNCFVIVEKPMQNDGFGGHQLASYTYYFEKYSAVYRHLAVFDCDEFFTPQNGLTIHNILEHFDELQADAVVFPMVNFTNRVFTEKVDNSKKATDRYTKLIHKSIRQYEPNEFDYINEYNIFTLTKCIYSTERHKQLIINNPHLTISPHMNGDDNFTVYRADDSIKLKSGKLFINFEVLKDLNMEEVYFGDLQINPKNCAIVKHFDLCEYEKYRKKMIRYWPDQDKKLCMKRKDVERIIDDKLNVYIHYTEPNKDMVDMIMSDRENVIREFCEKNDIAY